MGFQLSSRVFFPANIFGCSSQVHRGHFRTFLVEKRDPNSYDLGHFPVVGRGFACQTMGFASHKYGGGLNADVSLFFVGISSVFLHYSFNKWP